MSAVVLVADDDAVMLSLVANQLENAGYAVLRAEDGNELMQVLAHCPTIDLLVTDVSMPWMTGLQAAHSARAAGLDIPVIVMTALPIDATHVASLGGRTILMRKPFSGKTLQDNVRTLLG